MGQDKKKKNGNGVSVPFSFKSREAAAEVETGWQERKEEGGRREVYEVVGRVGVKGAAYKREEVGREREGVTNKSMRIPFFPQLPQLTISRAVVVVQSVRKVTCFYLTCDFENDQNQ